MGASPEINTLINRLLPDLNLSAEISRIGRIRIETVQDAQSQIVTMISLLAV